MDKSKWMLLTILIIAAMLIVLFSGSEYSHGLRVFLKQLARVLK